MNAATAFAASDDPALATLLHPFATGTLAWPAEGDVLFVRARDGAPLHDAPRARLLCEQSFKPFADALARGSLRCVASAEGRFALALLLPPRQRDEARAELARAVARLREGGTLVLAATNNEGAKSHEADLRRLLGSACSLSKYHGRACWSVRTPEGLDRALHEQWLALDAPRPIAGGRFVSRPGVFAWDRIDAASQALAEQLPEGLAGRCADLGAGYGFLSAELLARCPGVHSLDAYEADARALELARPNLARANAARARPATLDFLWHDVTTGLRARYDVIVTNPPFHVGRADLPDLGRAFIGAAADALVPGGALWLVANRHLPYEAALRERFDAVRCVSDAGGFKVIAAIRSGR